MKHKVIGKVVSGNSKVATNVTVFGEKNEEEKIENVNELFRIIKSGDGKIAEIIKKVPKNWIESRDEGGHTLTHWLAKRGDVHLLELVIDHGAPIDEASSDDVGMHPLHWACTEGRLGCARLLAKRGADLDARDLQGCTPLIIASQWGQADMVAFLIKMGATAQILDKNKDSALHWASYKGNLEIVGLLHHLGLPLDEPDAYGQTPLHLAALCGNLNVCEYLLLDLRFPVPLEPLDKNKKSPKDLALEKGHKKLAYFLDAQRPLCQQSLWTFIKHRLTFKACIYWLLGESNPDAWICFICAWQLDPGTLDKNSVHGALRRAYDKYFDRLVTGEMPPNKKVNAPPPVKNIVLCHSCHIQRPLRAKHCRVRRKCVMAFDHYCPYVGNAVGLYNYRFFYGYCLFFTLSALQWQYVATIYLYYHGTDYSLLSAMGWVALFILFGLAMVIYHTQLVYNNLTTNEHLNVHRYDYLHDPNNPLKFFNPYDKGFVLISLIASSPCSRTTSSYTSDFCIH